MTAMSRAEVSVLLRKAASCAPCAAMKSVRRKKPVFQMVRSATRSAWRKGAMMMASEKSAASRADSKIQNALLKKATGYTVDVAKS